MNAEELRHKDVWNGEYRGVRFEIVKWWMGGLIEDARPVWNYYLCIPYDQIPTELWKRFVLRRQTRKLASGRERVTYPYTASLLADLDWHGGITYYERLEESIKAGCDFVHSWDYGQEDTYTVSYVLLHAIRTVDSLRQLVPKLKWWCNYNGKFYPESEGTIHDNGTFTSNEGEAERKGKLEAAIE